VRFDAADLASHLALASEILSGGTLLIQPYLPEIESHGEWSLIFFDGELSHAVKKKPKAGDFRVQDDFGGTVTPETPPAFVVDGARRVLEAAGEEFLYARVDGVVSESLGGFLVNELEVVEPELFLRFDAGAPERFAAAIEKRVRAAR
jgi:glutathione synthase/RimK-type ligase-like ATP-grasp enzyme